MHLPAHSVQLMKGNRPPWLRIRTTLYDLIASISAETRTDDDDVVTATLAHLLKVRKVIQLGSFKYRRLVV
jgi:hypothetical protein